jgi:hypothetical protein
MAHFAQLDYNNIVINVIVVEDKELLNENNEEQESLGVTFCQKLLGENTRWIQTSDTAVFRKNYARVGEIYDVKRDAFRETNPPFTSWILNETTCKWEAPTPYPNDGKKYQWEESTKTWKDITPPSPFPSWQLNNGRWKAPIPYPTDGKEYRWNEKTVSWSAIEPILDGNKPKVI